MRSENLTTGTLAGTGGALTKVIELISSGEFWQAMLMALCAGFIGAVGQYLFKKLISKVKKSN